jgi:ankyrin repeat protein
VLNEMLVEAAWDNDVRRARRLIDRGADVNWRDQSVQSAFLIATSEGYLDLLELTLSRGADVTLHDSFDGTGLIRAAERGHWDIVGRLLQTGIAVDHVNNLGWVALHEAIILGDGSTRYVDTVRALVAGGASLRIAPERDGIAPVEHARSRGQAAVVSTLERALDAPDLDRPERSLLAAARTGDADAAAIALRQGADVDVRDGAGRTPLLIAVTEDRLAVARLLVAMGASPDALDDRHDTPWLVTGVTGSVPMAELLLRFDPDLTIRNRYGGVSIIPAAERGHVGYVRRVATTRIDLDHVNNLGWTALLEAIILGDGSARYVEIVSILLDHGADPTIRDGDGVSPLEHARDRGFTAIARMLRRED